MKRELQQFPEVECRACGKLTAVPLSHLCPWETQPRSYLHTRGFKVQGRKLRHYRGSEGSRHDPYAWEEYEVETSEATITLRSGGLGYLRLTIEGWGGLVKAKKEAFIGTRVFDEQVEAMRAVFREVTNMEMDDLERYYHRVHWSRIADPMGDPRSYE